MGQRGIAVAVRRFEAATSGTKSMASLPLSERSSSRTWPAASPVSACSRSVTTRAPALMNGLRGMPFSYSNCTRELNGLPEGSRPTPRHICSPSRESARARANTLDMDCVENGCCQSPTP